LIFFRCLSIVNSTRNGYNLGWRRKKALLVLVLRALYNGVKNIYIDFEYLFKRASRGREAILVPRTPPHQKNKKIE